MNKDHVLARYTIDGDAATRVAPVELTSQAGDGAVADAMQRMAVAHDANIEFKPGSEQTALRQLRLLMGDVGVDAAEVDQRIAATEKTLADFKLRPKHKRHHWRRK